MFASVDGSTLVILSAVGGSCATIGGVLWGALKFVYGLQIRSLTQRVDDCEEDRQELHATVAEQGERITELSLSLGRLEGRLDWER